MKKNIFIILSLEINVKGSYLRKIFIGPGNIIWETKVITDYVCLMDHICAQVHAWHLPCPPNPLAFPSWGAWQCG